MIKPLLLMHSVCCDIIIWWQKQMLPSANIVKAANAAEDGVQN